MRTFTIHRKSTNDNYTILVDDEDYERVMQFTWHVCWTRHKRGNEKTKFYVWATTYLNGKKAGRKDMALQRFLMNFPNGVVSFLNGNTFDCRKDNLVVGDRKMVARHAQHDPGSSKVKGVWIVKELKTNPYRARININGKETHLGNFPTMESAITARKSAEIEHDYYRPTQFENPLNDLIKEAR